MSIHSASNPSNGATSETSRLRARIAELEGVLRHLRGRPAPKGPSVLESRAGSESGLLEPADESRFAESRALRHLEANATLPITSWHRRSGHSDSGSRGSSRSDNWLDSSDRNAALTSGRALQQKDMPLEQHSPMVFSVLHDNIEREVFVGPSAAPYIINRVCPGSTYHLILLRFDDFWTHRSINLVAVCL